MLLFNKESYNFSHELHLPVSSLTSAFNCCVFMNKISKLKVIHCSDLLVLLDTFPQDVDFLMRALPKSNGHPISGLLLKSSQRWKL